jgi:hypothetical protein
MLLYRPRCFSDARPRFAKSPTAWEAELSTAGRRLGKTALLRHVQALHNNPLSNGSTVVGYANIRDMGALPSRIWDNASRELPAIFSGAVKTPYLLIPYFHDDLRDNPLLL